MTRIIRALGIAGALLTLSSLSSVALADGRDWNDGPVLNVSAIRTVDGHFDDYMHWLATDFKKLQEAAKAAGLITRYDVIVAEPHNAQEADIYLVIEYKNWAALDNLGGKFDQLFVKFSGSLEKSNQEEVDRGKIRTILGSQTMQVAVLK